MALLLGIFALVPEATLASIPSSSLAVTAAQALARLARRRMDAPRRLFGPAQRHVAGWVFGAVALRLGPSQLRRTHGDWRVLLVIKTFGVVLVVAAMRWTLGRSERRTVLARC